MSIASSACSASKDGALTEQLPTERDTPLLSARGIVKSFGPIEVLRGVNLTLRAGEVLGLLGDNGAGKSTLMKVLSGAVVPDQGVVHMEGRPAALSSPDEARRRGIEMVYQDLALCDSLSVAENLFLGREPVRRIGGLPFINHGALHREAASMLEGLKVKVPSVRAKVKYLSGGQRQAIAIGRAVSFEPKVLILDEPTAALAVREVEEVLTLIRRLSGRGTGVILVSHRLQDVMAVTDRIMVMCEGRNVSERLTGETTLAEVIQLIVQG